MTKLRFVFAVCALVGAGFLSATSSWAQDGAVIEQTAVSSALVHDVDLTTRQVLLETEDGRFVTVVAPPEVRNLPQVEVGDTVTIGYYGGIVASLVPPGAEPITTWLNSVP